MDQVQLVEAQSILNVSNGDDEPRLSARWQKLAPIMVKILVRIYNISANEALELVKRRARAVHRSQA